MPTSSCKRLVDLSFGDWQDGSTVDPRWKKRLFVTELDKPRLHFVDECCC